MIGPPAELRYLLLGSFSVVWASTAPVNCKSRNRTTTSPIRGQFLFLVCVQGNWTDYLYDVDGVFIAGDEVVAALEVIALSRSVTPSSSP